MENVQYFGKVEAFVSFLAGHQEDKELLPGKVTLTLTAAFKMEFAGKFFPVVNEGEYDEQLTLGDTIINLKVKYFEGPYTLQYTVEIPDNLTPAEYVKISQMTRKNFQLTVKSFRIEESRREAIKENLLTHLRFN